MRPDALLPTRKSFLLTLAGAALLQEALASAEQERKILIVVAHPDDEYAFAGSVYRLVREGGWTADQVVITDGESGFRYSTLAEEFYGVPLADAKDARTHLPAIRKEEARRAAKVLGLRNQYFLDQRDTGFDREASSADASNWDRAKVRAFLGDLLARERYDIVVTLLPTAQTHAHHREAALLTLEAVSELPAALRPLVFGVEAHGKREEPLRFAGLEAARLTRTVGDAPALAFDRTTPFGFRDSLDYRIVVNWVIAEHKSQGLFQMDYSKDELEQFWLFAVSGADSGPRLESLRHELSRSVTSTATR